MYFIALVALFIMGYLSIYISRSENAVSNLIDLVNLGHKISTIYYIKETEHERGLRRGGGVSEWTI